MSRVWLRMSDDFWLHLRPSVKFALVTLYRVMHTRPHLIQNFAIYIRSIFACDSRGQITRSAIRLPNHFLSPSFPLALSLSLTLSSLCPSHSFVFFHSLSFPLSFSLLFLLNSPLYRKYRSRLLCADVLELRAYTYAVASRIQTSPSLSSRAIPPSRPSSSLFFQPVLRVFARHHET